MQTKIEELDTCKKKISIEVSSEEIKGELEKEFEKIKGNAIVPGFRKGRAPRKLLEKRYGKQIEEEVKQAVISNSFQKAIEENNLIPLGTPEVGEINFNPDQPLNFDITLEVKPKIEIKDYKGLKLIRKKINVTDEMIDDEVKRLSLQKSPLTSVENGTISKGDLIICNSKIEVEGKVVLQEDNLEVYVSNRAVGNVYVPNLEESLLGLKDGEDTTIKIKLDNDFHIKECCGKDSELKILVNDIKRHKIPKIDDEFAKQFGFDSLDDLQDKIEMELEIQLKTISEGDIYSQVEEKLLELTDFDLPKGVVNSMAEERSERHRMDLLRKGVPLEKVQGITQRIKDESEDAVVRNLKLSLILEDIANKEKIYVTDTEVDKRIAEYARNYNITTEKMRNYLEKIDNIRSLRLQMRDEKMLAFLTREAEITEETKAIEDVVKDKVGR